jgi:hypothetical protein
MLSGKIEDVRIPLVLLSARSVCGYPTDSGWLAIKALTNTINLMI